MLGAEHTRSSPLPRRSPGPSPRWPAALLLVALTISLVGRVDANARPLLAAASRGKFIDGTEGTDNGYVGTLNFFERLADTIGTSLQLIARGRVRHGDVYHADRSGPMAFAYRRAYLQTAIPKCEGGISQRCNVAADGLGTIGRVAYNHSNSIANIQGNAFQTQLSCLCINVDCTLSVLVHPVSIISSLTEAERKTQCLLVYNEEVGKLVSCLSEMLRIRPNTPDSYPYEDSRSWSYTVDADSTDFWNATGYRGRPSREMTQDEFDTFPEHDRSVYSYSSGEVESHVLFETPAGDTPVSLRRGVQPAFPNRQVDPCDEPFKVAANGAIWIATQQDRQALAQVPDTYLSPPPGLISDTELALVGSAAALGTLAGFSILSKAEKDLLDADISSTHFQKSASIRRYVGSVTIALLAFVLEALPLQVAFSTELEASNWVTETLHMDATMGVNGNSQLGTIGEVSTPSNGSIVVQTLLLGKTEYIATRVVFVGILTVCFDLLFALRLIYHTISQVSLVRTVWRYFHETTAQSTETLERSGSEPPGVCSSENMPSFGKMNSSQAKAIAGYQSPFTAGVSSLSSLLTRRRGDREQEPAPAAPRPPSPERLPPPAHRDDSVM